MSEFLDKSGAHSEPEAMIMEDRLMDEKSKKSLEIVATTNTPLIKEDFIRETTLVSETMDKDDIIEENITTTESEILEVIDLHTDMDIHLHTMVATTPPIYLGSRANFSPKIMFS